jgi:hypothetical protein
MVDGYSTVAIVCCVFAAPIASARILSSNELPAVAASDLPSLLWDGNTNRDDVEVPAFERLLTSDEWAVLNRQHEKISSLRTFTNSTAIHGAAVNEATGVVAGRKRRIYQNGFDQPHLLNCG